MISFIPLFAVNVPPLLSIFFARLLSTHGEVAVLPNIPSVLVAAGSDRTLVPINNQFRDYAFPTTNFLILSGKKLTMWAIIAVMFPFVIYMH